MAEPSAAFAMFSTFLHLDGPSAEPMPVTPEFWSDLETGRRKIPGWLVSAFKLTGDIDHWEMHPAGDEILYALSGRMIVVLDDAGVERRITVAAGTACMVPRGTWHTILVPEPSSLLALTFGTGTEHRPA